MRRIFIGGLVWLAMVAMAFGDPKIAKEIQDTEVTIKSGSSEGSGNIVNRETTLSEKDKTKVVVTFIWTAGHVIDDLRRVRTVIDEDGKEKKVVEFGAPNIVQEKRQNGRRVGESKLECQVVKFSDSDNGEDLALLMLLSYDAKEFVDISTVFRVKDTYDEELVPVGTELYHCGSLLGQMGANSFTTGVLSQVGRVYKNSVYDQSTVPAFPGSSGGGVFMVENENPVYVGMITRGSGETFNLMVPIRRMHDWAKRVGIEWAVNPKIPTPTIEEIKKIKVEVEGDASSSSTRQMYNNSSDSDDIRFLDGESHRRRFKLEYTGN